MIRSVTLTSYLVDEDGDYVLTVDGDRIIVGTDTLMSYDTDYMKVARFAPGRQVKNFLVQQLGTKWHLRVNRAFVGRFPTQEAALGCLVGMIYRAGCPNEERLDEILEGIISRHPGALGGDTGGTPVPPTLNTALWSIGTSLANQNEPYYRLASDEFDTTAMQDAIDLIDGSPKLITLYPDKVNSMDSPWKDFSLVGDNAWDGDTNTLPQIDPAGYVTALDDQISSGYIDSLDGVAVLMDWEYGTTETQNLATTYWNDEDNPQFQTACIELRLQLKAVYDAMKAAYPNTFFGQYGATCSFPNGDLKFKTSAQVASEGSGTVDHLSHNGLNSRGRLQAAQTQNQTDQVNQNAIDAMTATVMPWDFTTQVCYDYFGGDALAREASASFQFASTDRPEYRIENCAWTFDKLKTQYPDVPALGIISPSNVAQNYNFMTAASNRYGWAEPFDFVDVTIASIKDADGYLIWDNLLMDQQKHYLENFDDWAAVIATPGQQAARLDDWSMMEAMETRFGYLTAFKAMFPASIPGDLPTAPNEWFNETIRSERQTLASKNLFAGFLAESWRDEMIPLLEYWRSTGRLPYAMRNPSTVTGTAELGQTLTAVTDFAGEDMTVSYRWRNSASSTNLGSDSTYVVQASDAGETIECRILVRDLNGETNITHENITVTTAAVPAADPTKITNTFGGTGSGFSQFTWGPVEWAQLTDSAFFSPATVTAINGSPMTIALSGATSINVTTSSTIEFFINGSSVGTEAVLTPTTNQFNIAAGAVVTALAVADLDDEITMVIT